MARRPGRPGHSDEVKAAVLAALLTGQSISTVAEEYKLPVGTVARWSSEAGSVRSPVAEERRADLGALILACLEAQLRTKLEILKSVSDPAWLHRQGASEIAVLFGVIDDKTFRTLQALPEPEDGESPDAA